MNPEIRQTTTARGLMSPATALNILLGIWLFISPWVFGSGDKPNAWNAWIVGALIAIIAAVRIATPGGLKPLGFLNMLLGIWVFASPWIFGFTGNTARFADSLCVGVLVFVLSISSWSSSPTIAIPVQR